MQEQHEEEKNEWERQQKSLVAMVEAYARQPDHIVTRYLAQA